MDSEGQASRRENSRKRHNDEFVKRLMARRPHDRRRYESAFAEAADREGVRAEAAGMRTEGVRRPSRSGAEVVAETIVRRERPVLFVKNDWLDVDDATIIGPEARELVDNLNGKRAILQPLMPLIGRIDVAGFSGGPYVGTGWFVDTNIVVTNRHVASLVARHDGRNYVFKPGVTGKPYVVSLCTAHEFDDLDPDASRVFTVREVLYIERDSSPVDIAFLKVVRQTDGSKRDRITVARGDVAAETRVCVIGYPARASKAVIPDQELMKELYRDRYDVKRAAPGLTMPTEDGASRHDCTTLGGNSGSFVADVKTGEAVGLHFAGLYQETNYAVRASVLYDYVSKKRWTTSAGAGASTLPPPKMPPADVGTSGPGRGGRTQGAGTGREAPPPSGGASVTFPLTITVSVGASTTSATVSISAPASTSGPMVAAETAARDFWDNRPEGVIGVRVGFFDDGEEIGDTPFIAASVPADRVADVEAGAPAHFHGLDVRYVPATMAEQIEAVPIVESVDNISYDDDARTGKAFSFAPIEEEMVVRVHVGPEYSWEELDGFLSGAQGSIVSAIYEFHAPQIKDALEARLNAGASLKLVTDNATFTEMEDEDQEFDRRKVFTAWKKKFKGRFVSVVAPEGVSGLISDSYHIKVTVREDDTLWLSSGNWKKQSSQPVISQQQRDDAAETDLPGNREWHVIIKNKTLAGRFRSHIEQDFVRSQDLGAGPFPKIKEATDILVDVPIEEAIELERRPPSRVLEPRDFDGSIKVTPLLTPDKQGAVYSKAVLELIRSAKHSLLFQIPYIGMPSNPKADRGYIDELIKVLTEKLTTLDDARVILRTGGSAYSNPTHAAWYFKSKGVDIAERVRRIEDHHTKGMIVDGKRVLIGSHNWSKPGVSLNRDASLIFDNEGIAGYYAEAFEIDWERANPIKPKRYVKNETVVQEAVGAKPPPGFRRVPLSELLKEDD